MSNWIQLLVGETRAKLLGLLRRSHQTINSLSETLGLTDNAVRTHMAALGRDGIVTSVGQTRVAAGKPARIYALTPEGEELFPKAYAVVLRGLIDEIAGSEGKARAAELLGAVGRRAGAAAGAEGSTEARVAVAAEALRGLGGDVEVQSSPDGWRLQGFGCPLTSVTAANPEACELARALVEEVTGRPVTECCERGERPRCAFLVSADAG